MSDTQNVQTSTMIVLDHMLCIYVHIYTYPDMFFYYVMLLLYCCMQLLIVTNKINPCVLTADIWCDYLKLSIL